MTWIKLVLGVLLLILALGVGLTSACTMKGMLGNTSVSSCAERYGLAGLSRAEAGYPAAWALTLLLGGVAVVAARNAFVTAQAYPRQTTWRVTRRLFGWLYVAGSAGIVALMLLASTADQGRGMEALTTLRVVESLVPVVIGVQAALMCSLDDEPGLEVLLAAPRPFAWIVLERIGVVLALHGLVAVTGSLAAMAIQHIGIDSLPLMMARWLAPAVFFAGLGLWVTFSARNAAFGACMVIAVWSAMVIGFDNLLARWPLLWPIHVYLQPGGAADNYALNRIVIGLLGVFFLVNAVRELRDEERVLLGKVDGHSRVFAGFALPGRTEQAGITS